MTPPNPSNATAVVTGAARGIGAAAARRFHAMGYHVALLDMDAEGGPALAGELGARAVFHRCDVADEAAVEQLAATVEAQMPPVQVLLTSAGLIPNAETVMDMDMAYHERMWKVNYFGTVHACRSFGRRMAGRRSGAIVTVGSINGLLPLPLPAYNPGKAAIARLTQLLAVELGRHNVRVNSVAPTYVMTAEMRRRIDTGLRDEAKMMAVHALDRLPQPDDIAQAIAFLCSPEASMITGVTLPVDSGWAAAVSYKTYAGGVPWKD